jgi:hypothetical protein
MFLPPIFLPASFPLKQPAEKLMAERFTVESWILWGKALQFNGLRGMREIVGNRYLVIASCRWHH